VSAETQIIRSDTHARQRWAPGQASKNVAKDDFDHEHKEDAKFTCLKWHFVIM
jgi:hypothetical protein